VVLNPARLYNIKFGSKSMREESARLVQVGQTKEIKLVCRNVFAGASHWIGAELENLRQVK
jgi:hypothetical protein